MEDDALNMRNWGYYEPTFKGHLGLQLMSSMAERDTKPFLPGRDPNSVMIGANNGSYHPRDCVVSDSSNGPVTMNYGREWISQRDKLINMLPHQNHHNNYTANTTTSSTITNVALPETSGLHQHQQHHHVQIDNNNNSSSIEEHHHQPKEVVATSSKKRQSNGNNPKAPKVKKPRKVKETNNNNNNNGSNSSVPRLKAPKKTLEVVINGIDMDISGIPIPVCSCTGAPQQCYRWGCGGWQSACCTTNVSVYPLPMSTKRRGARIAGRKMSQGAFKKVLEKLAAEGYNFANPIDLRTFWARHGTNKFVTIR